MSLCRGFGIWGRYQCSQIHQWHPRDTKRNGTLPTAIQIQCLWMHSRNPNAEVIPISRSTKKAFSINFRLLSQWLSSESLPSRPYLKTLLHCSFGCIQSIQIKIHGMTVALVLRAILLCFGGYFAIKIARTWVIVRECRTSEPCRWGILRR